MFALTDNAQYCPRCVSGVHQSLRSDASWLEGARSASKKTKHHVMSSWCRLEMPKNQPSGVWAVGFLVSKTRASSKNCSRHNPQGIVRARKSQAPKTGRYASGGKAAARPSCILTTSKNIQPSRKKNLEIKGNVHIFMAKN